jgi:hypothetical protein
MTNVIDFQTRPRRPGAPRCADPAIQDRTSRIRGLHSPAKAEVDRSILLLDLAAQHAREIESRIADPDIRRAFEMHIDAIEEAIQIARQRTCDV